MRTKVKHYGNHEVLYRPGTSDENVLAEVIDREEYHKPSVKFDVERGERWLDLGANVGAFAVYCKLRGATAVCYEPDPDNFSLLVQNADPFECFNAAVSTSTDMFVQLHRPRDHTNSARMGLTPARNMEQHVAVPNVCMTVLCRQGWDGVKMDVEGAEGPILDCSMIPRCDKLVLEYHTSRDRSVENLRRRIDWLKTRFRHVLYRPEYDRLMKAGGQAKTFFDRLIFCWN